MGGREGGTNGRDEREGGREVGREEAERAPREVG